MVRFILSPEAALDIYASRHIRSLRFLALHYGISDKTVRDVWTGRTWGSVTGARAPRPLGRPPGSRTIRAPQKPKPFFVPDDPFFDDYRRYRDLVTKLVRAHDAQLCAISRTHLTSDEPLPGNSPREVFAYETPRAVP